MFIRHLIDEFLLCLIFCRNVDGDVNIYKIDKFHISYSAY